MKEKDRLEKETLKLLNSIKGRSSKGEREGGGRRLVTDLMILCYRKYIIVLFFLIVRMTRIYLVDLASKNIYSHIYNTY